MMVRMPLGPTPRFLSQRGSMSFPLTTHGSMPSSAAPCLGHCSNSLSACQRNPLGAWHKNPLGAWSSSFGAPSLGQRAYVSTHRGMGNISPAQITPSVAVAAAAAADGSEARQGSRGRDVWQRGGGPKPEGGASRAREGSSQDPSSQRRRPSRDSSSGRRPSSRGRPCEDAEPVVFRAPFPTDPEVAILGGGLSGLMCALSLAERGIRSTVFDTGRHGWGGRLGTRHLDLPGLAASAPDASGGPATAAGASGDAARESRSPNQAAEAVPAGAVRGEFDHAAQYFTVSDPRFESQVAKWLQRGWVREWAGSVGTLRPGGAFTPLPVTDASASAGASPTLQGASLEPLRVSFGPSATVPTASAAPSTISAALACEPAASRLAPSSGDSTLAARESTSLGGLLDSGKGRKASLIGQGWPQVDRRAGIVPQASGAAVTSLEVDDHSPGSKVRRGARYVGTGGMRHLADRLAEECSQTGLVSLERPIWITRMRFSGTEVEGGAGVAREKWRLVDEYGKARGEYDLVVIAHNGKCANRLLAPAGVPLVAGQMRRLQLSSIWCSMIAFAAPLPVPTTGNERGDPPSRRGLPHEEEGGAWSGERSESRGQERMEGAFVEGVPSVAWMCNNSAKLGGGEGHNSGGAGGSDRYVENWTVFSSAAYGRQNKVPQERVPPHVAERVKEEMLEGVRAALGVSPDEMPPVVHHRVQLWGAALPLNAPGVEYIFDPSSRSAICGDWLMGPSMEAAALSGMSLATRISKFAAEGTGEGLGLRDPLVAISGAHDIGAFP